MEKRGYIDPEWTPSDKTEESEKKADLEKDLPKKLVESVKANLETKSDKVK